MPVGVAPELHCANHLALAHRRDAQARECDDDPRELVECRLVPLHRVAALGEGVVEGQLALNRPRLDVVQPDCLVALNCGPLLLRDRLQVALGAGDGDAARAAQR